MKKFLSIIFLLITFALPQMSFAAQTTSLSEMVTYYNKSIALTQENIKATHTLQTAITKAQKTQQTQGQNPFAAITWDTMIAYPFDTLQYAGKIFFQTYIMKNQSQQTQSDAIAAAKKKEVQIASDQLALEEVQLEQLHAAKTYVLSVTRNDEKIYKDFLATSQEELRAEQEIFAGKATEAKIGVVKQGESFGNIISDTSSCSTGTYLHFEIRDHNNPVDPSKYLKNAAVRYTSLLERQEQFTGTWFWPITSPAVITQEFGMSWFAKPGGFSLKGSYNGSPHTGIDMISDTDILTVFVPADGTLFVGKEACGDGVLNYLRIEHSPTLSSYYLYTIR